MIIPLIASISGACGVVLEKLVLTRQRMGYLLYTALVFVTTFGMMLVVSPFLLSIKPKAASLNYLVLLGAVVMIAVAYNLLFFYGIKKEKVTEIEPFAMFIGIFSVVLAATFFVSERETKTLVLAVIATSALLLSHIEKRHLKINKYSLAVLLHSFLVAVEGLFIKILLSAYSPFSLYFVRTGLIAAVLLLWFKPRLERVTCKNLKYVLATNALVIVQFVFAYWSIAVSGIVFTSLIMSVMPIFIYAGSVFFLKEKLKKKHVWGAAVILLCLVLLQLL
jgi:drug/metabolite transporter (DMT)-like permease